VCPTDSTHQPLAAEGDLLTSEAQIHAHVGEVGELHPALMQIDLVAAVVAEGVTLFSPDAHILPLHRSADAALKSCVNTRSCACRRQAVALHAVAVA